MARGKCILCEVVGSGESFAAVRANVGPLLGVCSHVSKTLIRYVSGGEMTKEKESLPLQVL